MHARLAARLRFLAVAGAVLAAPLGALAQTPPSGTGITVTGGAAPASTRVPDGAIDFTLRVPLRPNSENVMTLTATDPQGRTARVPDISVTQLTLTDIVRARVTAQRLTPQEVRALVAEGTINLADPENYNVSRFVIALTVEGRPPIQVSVPVVRRVDFPMGAGEEVTVGCAGRSSSSSGVQTTERSISIPCGGGGDGAQPEFRIIPFEAVIEDLPGRPSIPGVILIEGRIKTLKEFYKVTLFLLNVSEIFTLTDVEATIALPPDVLSHVAPAGGVVRIDTLGPGQEGSGEFIIRGDEIGTHTVTAHFGGNLTSPFLSEPVPIAGSASTDVVVKGPPVLGVRVSHPDYVVAFEPYDLIIEITNNDTELDALYTSMALDIGHDARLLDEETGLPIQGPVDRSLGDIMRGENRVLRYRVLPFVTGSIASCTAAASQNIQLSIGFRGPNGPPCAIGTLPAERTSDDGRPTVTVIPTHNTSGVALNPAIVALFSAPMITQTVTTGFTEATFKVIDAVGNIVPGTLSFGQLFNGTSVVFRPVHNFTAEAEYTIVVESNIYSEEGLALASGSLSRFRTGAPPAPSDSEAPTVSLAVEAPLTASSITRGQLIGLASEVTDNVGFTRVELYLQATLIDTKRPGTNLRFLVDTASLTPGEPYNLTAVAFDAAGNQAQSTVLIQIAADVLAPAITVTAPSTVGRGGAVDVVVATVDAGRVARVDLFLDNDTAPIWTGVLAPFQTTLDSTSLAPGVHRLRAVAVDGGGNQSIVEHTFTVVADSELPIVAVTAPLGGAEVRQGTLLQVTATAVDNAGIARLELFLDDETEPRGAGTSGIAIDTAGLGLGAHVIRARATDIAGNVAIAQAAFSVVTTPSDQTAPAPPLAALIVPTAGANGLLTLAGQPGAVEAGARVIATNLTTQAVGQSLAGPDGAFTVQVEGQPGQTIAVVAEDAAGNRSLPANIRVPEPLRITALQVLPTAITLDRTTRSATLSVTALYSDQTAATITSGLSFVSSAPSIASVTSAGQVLPGQNGSAVITVSLPDSPEVPATTVAVTSNFPTLTGVTVTPTALALTGVNQTAQISVTAQYSDGTIETFTGSVAYGSQNVSVAVVDSRGVVRSLSLGQTVITVLPSGFAAVQVPVEVAGREPTGLTVSPTSLLLTSLGQSATLEARLQYNDGSSIPAPGATFVPVDAGVVMAEGNGLVTALAEGVTSVVVSSSGFIASIPVTVDLPAQTPPPVITSLGRDIVGEGDSLVILGTYFSGLTFDNDVTVGGVAAEVQRAAADRLVVRVPAGATTGNVQVIVDGQSSNLAPVSVYARVGKATPLTGAFSVVSPTPGQAVTLGPVTLDVRAGDVVWLTGHAETVVGRQFTTMPGPAFTGTLTVTIDGTPQIVSPSLAPVDLSAQLGPGLHTLTAELTATAGSLSSHGLALISGPPATGAFTGVWTTTGDYVAQTKTLRFAQLTTNAGLPIADGTRLAVTAENTYRVSDGGCCNNSIGGTVLSGTAGPSGNRLVTVESGALTVEVSDVGLYVAFGQTLNSVVSLFEVNANGNVTNNRPVASATIRVGSVHSATVLPEQTSATADGVNRPFPVEVSGVRDNLGNAVPDGANVGLTAVNWYRRSDGGCCNNSAGGTVSGGTATSDGSFRGALLTNGRAEFLYSSNTLALTTGTVDTAVLASRLFAPNGAEAGNRPFAEGRVTLSSAALGTATGSALPTSLTATTADNRSVVTIRNIVDAGGRPVPNGSLVSVSAVNWYRVTDGGCCNNSEGGTIVSGTVDPRHASFRLHPVQDGSVVLTYSAAGLVLGPQQTATAVVSVMPAAPTGYVGTRPFLSVPITLAGLSGATVTPAISSMVADGVSRPNTVTVSNVVDALGQPVPDGTRVALTAVNWYRVSDGGCCNGSWGGALVDGDPNPNGSFRTYTVMNGGFQASYSAASAPLAGAFSTHTAFISAVVANVTTGALPFTRPFGVGAIALGNGANGTITATPPTLLGDTADRRSTISIGGLVDSSGRQIPDGTRVALTTASWYRSSDGGCCNNSFGGAIVDGTINGSWRLFTVANGAVQATFSSAGLVREPSQTANAVVAVMPADVNGNVIGSRPVLEVPIRIIGVGSATVTAPATVSPGGSVAFTVSDVRDADGQLVPDGARVAVTAINWYRAGTGSCCNGSDGGTITGGSAATNDGNFRVGTLSGGSVTFTFTAPPTNNQTSVISVVSAGPGGARVTQTPFAAAAIRVTTTP